MKNLSERVRYLRDVSGLDFIQIDDRAGLARGHTALIAAGFRGNPTVATIRSVARVFGWQERQPGALSLDWLIGGIGEPPTIEEIRSGVARAERRPL